ncbi:MAG: hypothetical protein AAGF11_29850 [Myxococcota bacterium]
MTEGRGVLREVLAFVGVDVPGDLELRPGPDAVREGGPNDDFPDGMMVAQGTTDRKTLEAFVVEVQLSENPRKRFTWPLYVVVSRNRLRCPTTLVVLTDSDEVARWATRLLESNGDVSIRAIVIGPRQIPHTLSMEQAREVPALAVLAVVAHGRGPKARRLGSMAWSAVRPLVDRGDELGMLYMDVLFAYLDPSVLEEIREDDMKALGYEPISPYFKRRDAEMFAKGRTKGMARMLERLLERQGLDPTEEQRHSIVACNDPTTLQHWFDRALGATNTTEIFEA